MILFPLYRTYTVKHETSLNEKTTNMTLPIILSSQEGIQAFLSFVKQEFSAENLLYYLQVDEWLKIANSHPFLSGIEKSSRMTTSESPTSEEDELLTHSSQFGSTPPPSPLIVSKTISSSPSDPSWSQAQLNASLAQRSYELLENYLIANATFSINLSAENREEVCRAIEQYDLCSSSSTLKHLVTAYSTTKNEIFHLMETDSFARFLQSSQYENYKKK